MTSQPSQLDQRALVLHPSASISTPGASLPRALLDPNPRLTLVLHQLWTALKPFLVLDGERGSFRPLDSKPNMSAADALIQVRSYLVSLNPLRSRPLYLHYDPSARLPPDSGGHEDRI
jgi:hypothetical protein